MKVHIKLIRQLGEGQKHVINITGDVVVLSDMAETQKVTAQTLFESEFAINSHVPHVRAHIEIIE